MVKGATNIFDMDDFLAGRMTPVFFGTALGNFGVREMLNDFVRWAPMPQPRATDKREVVAEESAFSGCVFKIQANMDPKHRDRPLHQDSAPFLRHGRLKRAALVLTHLMSLEGNFISLAL